MRLASPRARASSARLSVPGRWLFERRPEPVSHCTLAPVLSCGPRRPSVLVRWPPEHSLSLGPGPVMWPRPRGVVNKGLGITRGAPGFVGPDREIHTDGPRLCMGLQSGWLVEHHSGSAVALWRSGSGSPAVRQMEMHKRFTRKYCIGLGLLARTGLSLSGWGNWAFGQLFECWCCCEQQMCVGIVDVVLLATGSHPQQYEDLLLHCCTE